MKQQFLINTQDSFQTYIYENNRKIIPASALATIYKPGGNAKLVDGLPMAIGADGLLSYELSASDNASVGVNYKAVIAYVYNSKTYYATLFYDVVRSRLQKVITDEDIINELPQLRDNGWKVSGTAESGTDSTIVDTELKRYEDDYFTGGTAYSTDKDEKREVTGFASSTGTVTVSAFSSAVAAGEKYILTRSFSKEIQRAFEKIEEKFVRLGKRPHLVLDPYDLREAHIYYSVAEACKGFVTESENIWWQLWKEYEKKAEDTFGSLELKYDFSNDGYIAGGETDMKINRITAGRR